METIEIDLNQIVDKSISAAVVLLCFFVGMRLLYGYWQRRKGRNNGVCVQQRVSPIHQPRSKDRSWLRQRSNLSQGPKSSNQTVFRFLRSHCRPTSTQRRIRLIARCPESTKHDYKLFQEPRRPAWLRLSQRQQSSLQT